MEYSSQSSLDKKNYAWAYVIGEKRKSRLVAGDDVAGASVAKWEDEDRKAKSDIILSTNPSKLKQIKNCVTLNELWVKLQNIYTLERRLLGLLGGVSQESDKVI